MPAISAAQAFELALAQHRAGRLAEAEALFRRVLAVEPQHAAALHSLGIIASQTGRGELAVELLRQAIAHAPSEPAFHCNLGVALSARGEFGEAAAACRRALDLQPDYAMAAYNLGTALENLGRADEAIVAYQRALALQPACTRARCNLANVLRDAGRIDEALSEYRRAVELDPADPIAHNNLGDALRDVGRIDEAIASVWRAVALRPDDAALHSNVVYFTLFDPGATAQTQAEEAAGWHRRHEAHLLAGVQPHANRPEPGRRLKIGYVSPDFWRHVICHFLVPLLEAHDHTRFEIHCYASVKRPDHVTTRLRKSADVWRDVPGVPDDALAQMIRADGIDILVDLTQHMADNRLPLFACKPAPVQVAWLGYPGTTGLHAIDYQLTDAWMEPEGAPWSVSVEKVVRLPDSWFCFDPIDDYPPPGELPALRAGHVTFGCLNNFCKVAEPVLERWAAVLRAVEGSHLLLRCPAGAAQARVREFFKARGIGVERLELVAWVSSREEFLRLFERIDIALDPFPYNGGTTTCEALWMGVPVLTLPGSLVVSRIGMSILSAAGMPEFVAGSEAGYIELAASLARDLPGLARLRATLRERMRVSPFMDAPRFARNVEHAYRQMWQAWCAAR